MRRSIALVTAAVSPFVGLGVPAHATVKAPSSLADQLAMRMVRALDAQPRIVVNGYSNGPGSLKTHYLLRYLARGREFLSQRGGPWGKVQIGGQTVAGVNTIYIGKQAFTSMDMRHWYRTSRPSTPRPLDALSLNIANTPCCVVDIPGSHVKLSMRGSLRWRGNLVQALDFRCFANGYHVTGEVLINPQSNLPLHYTQRSRTPNMAGSFNLTYGGSFSINAPH